MLTLMLLQLRPEPALALPLQSNLTPIATQVAEEATASAALKVEAFERLRRREILLSTLCAVATDRSKYRSSSRAWWEVIGPPNQPPTPRRTNLTSGVALLISSDGHIAGGAAVDGDGDGDSGGIPKAPASSGGGEDDIARIVHSSMDSLRKVLLRAEAHEGTSPVASPLEALVNAKAPPSLGWLHRTVAEICTDKLAHEQVCDLHAISCDLHMISCDLLLTVKKAPRP